MSLSLMVCFARSGGTILNRCLGSLPDVVIMSEVNPVWSGSGDDADLSTVRTQAKQWYNIDLRSENYTDSILELEEICNKEGKHLVIRDWPFINFVPFPFNNMKPAGSLVAIEELTGKCDFKAFAFVRDAIDVWISRGADPDVESFFNEYLAYVKAVVATGMPVFKYEDFCSDPDSIMKEICEYTGIPYSESYRNYASFVNAKGDIERTSPSRGAKKDFIRPLKRKLLSAKKMKRLKSATPCTPQMREANSLLNYPTYEKGINLRGSFFARALDRLFR